MLVGNKSDLQLSRQVEVDEGKALADQWGKCPFFSTSAKLNINVSEAFVQCCREIRDRVEKSKPVRKQQRNRVKKCMIV